MKEIVKNIMYKEAPKVRKLSENLMVNQLTEILQNLHMSILPATSHNCNNSNLPYLLTKRVDWVRTLSCEITKRLLLKHLQTEFR
jgi:hypothetical protein